MAQAKEWLRIYHLGGVMRMPRYEDGDGVRLVLCSRMFDMVKTLKGVPWETVEKALETFRASLFTQTPHEVFAPDS